MLIGRHVTLFNTGIKPAAKIDASETFEPAAQNTSLSAGSISLSLVISTCIVAMVLVTSNASLQYLVPSARMEALKSVADLNAKYNTNHSLWR